MSTAMTVGSACSWIAGDCEIDWEAVGAVATFLATFIALFSALLPHFLQRRNAHSRLRALSRIVFARLQNHIDALSAASNLGSDGPSDSVFNYAVDIALNARPEQLVELMPHLEGFGPDLASRIAEYIAGLESMRRELTVDTGRVKKAPKDFFALPDHGGMYRRLLLQCAVLRQDLSGFVYGRSTEAVTEQVRRVREFVEQAER